MSEADAPTQNAARIRNALKRRKEQLGALAQALRERQTQIVELKKRLDRQAAEVNLSQSGFPRRADGGAAKSDSTGVSFHVHSNLPIPERMAALPEVRWNRRSHPTQLIARRILGRVRGLAAKHLPTRTKAAIKRLLRLDPPAGGESYERLPEYLRVAITQSRLFDANYYRSHYSRFVKNDDLILDYLSAYPADRDRDPGPLFSTQHYTETYPETGRYHPFLHYIEYGMREGRTAFPASKLNNYLSSASRQHSPLPISTLLPRSSPISVRYWPKGNFFFADIAHYVAAFLKHHGYGAKLNPDGPIEPDGLDLIVAPHEFCALGPGRDWSAAELACAAYLNTEQWQTGWFSLSYEFIKRTTVGVLDINPESAAGFAKLGFPSAFLPLLPLPGTPFDHAQGRGIRPSFRRLTAIKDLTFPVAFHERPYDIMFVGTSNSKRGRALAQLASVLSKHECFLHNPFFDRPINPNDPDMLDAADFCQIAENCKILLNIHRDECSYFEWHRILLFGMMQGCVVVTEPCIPNAYTKAGEHYIECSLDDMGPILDRLLLTEVGRSEMMAMHLKNRELRSVLLNRFLGQ